MGYSQDRIMDLLSEQGPLTAVQVAETLGMRRPNVWRMLNSLSKYRMVQRIPCPRQPDGCTVVWSVTP